MSLCMLARVCALVSFVFVAGIHATRAAPDGASSPETDELRKIKVDAEFSRRVSEQFEWPVVSRSKDGTTFLLSASQVDSLGTFLHDIRGRCGGFRDVTDGEWSMPLRKFRPSRKRNLTDYFRWKVAALADEVSEDRIRATVEKLSSFETRRFDSDGGLAASTWLKAWLKEQAGGRDDVQVELFSHSWKMPSVIARIQGTDRPAERVIVGGHLDSINWQMFGKHAPGADDDASGVAAALEAFTVLLRSGYQPSRTIEFMAYSGEEVGLRGSQAIARSYAAQAVPVAGVMQLDMVLYPEIGEELFFVMDHIDVELTKFTRELARGVLGYQTSETKCGYACSDHASWRAAGFPVVFPFEAASENMNPFIHTEKDTLETSDHRTDHAKKFSQLALVFLMEMAQL